MPNVRSKDQIFIGTWIDKAFANQIDAARGSLTRSQYCRDALREKIEKAGIDIGALLTTPPDRSGKGGPKKYLRLRHLLILNEGKPNSNVDAEVIAAADKLEALARKKILARGKKKTTAR